MREGRSPVYAALQSPSLLEYPGHLAGVFFISGCNFRCGYCHNADLIQKRAGFPWAQLEEICEQLLDQWVDAAVVTGGEPTIAPDLPALLDLLKGCGWKVKLDTNGSRPDVLEQLLPRVDFVSMDVKCGLSGYADMTCFGDAGKIATSIALIKERAARYEFRTTVVESYHTEQQMLAIGDLIRGAHRYVLQPFVPRPHLRDPAYRQRARTPPSHLEHLRHVMRGYADEVVVHDAHG